MAKPTADTDKELIQQIKNLKEGMIERVIELQKRGYIIGVTTSTAEVLFVMEISKTVETREVI